MIEGPFNIDGRIYYTRGSLLDYCTRVTDGKTEGMADGNTDGKTDEMTDGMTDGNTDGKSTRMPEGKTAGVAAGMPEPGDKQEWKEKLYRFISDLLNEDRPVIQQTSGTTGDPKMYELSRTAMLNSAKMTLAYFGLKPGNTALLCLPVDYIAGKMMVVRAFEGNLRLVTSAPSGNPLNELNQQPVDFAAMVPLQVFEAMKTPDKLNESIGTLLIGGGEISEALRNKIRKLDKVRVYESFAMTETLTHFALRRLNGPGADPLFRTLEGVSIGSDDRGCLTVNAEGITRGTVQTNDLVKIHAPGAFEWLGRLDNVINTGGIKVIPEMIEAKIRARLGREILVLGLPDEKLGQKLVLIIEGEGESKGEPLLALLKTALAKHEIPREVFFLKEFPRNRSMKTDRKEVQRMIGEPG